MTFVRSAEIWWSPPWWVMKSRFSICPGPAAMSSGAAGETRKSPRLISLARGGREGDAAAGVDREACRRRPPCRSPRCPSGRDRVEAVPPSSVRRRPATVSEPAVKASPSIVRVGAVLQPDRVRAVVEHDLVVRAGHAVRRPVARRRRTGSSRARVPGLRLGCGGCRGGEEQQRGEEDGAHRAKLQKRERRVTGFSSVRPGRGGAARLGRRRLFRPRRSIMSFGSYAAFQARLRVLAHRRSAEGHRRPGRGGGDRRPRGDPPGGDRHGQDDDDGGDDRAPAAAGADHGPQQDARGAAVQRVPDVLPEQRRRVLRLLLRLLPARGLRPDARTSTSRRTRRSTRRSTGCATPPRRRCSPGATS